MLERGPNELRTSACLEQHQRELLPWCLLADLLRRREQGNQREHQVLPLICYVPVRNMEVSRHWSVSWDL